MPPQEPQLFRPAVDTVPSAEGVHPVEATTSQNPIQKIQKALFEVAQAVPEGNPERKILEHGSRKLQQEIVILADAETGYKGEEVIITVLPSVDSSTASSVLAKLVPDMPPVDLDSLRAIINAQPGQEKGAIVQHIIPQTNTLVLVEQRRTIGGAWMDTWGISFKPLSDTEVKLILETPQGENPFDNQSTLGQAPIDTLVDNNQNIGAAEPLTVPPIVEPSPAAQSNSSVSAIPAEVAPIIGGVDNIQMPLNEAGDSSTTTTEPASVAQPFTSIDQSSIGLPVAETHRVETNPLGITSVGEVQGQSVVIPGGMYTVDAAQSSVVSVSPQAAEAPAPVASVETAPIAESQSLEKRINAVLDTLDSDPTLSPDQKAGIEAVRSRLDLQLRHHKEASADGQIHLSIVQAGDANSQKIAEALVHALGKDVSPVISLDQILTERDYVKNNIQRAISVETQTPGMHMVVFDGENPGTTYLNVYLSGQAAEDFIKHVPSNKPQA